MSLLFYGIKWATNPAQPYIWYGDPTKTEIIKRELKIGDDFNLKILGHTYCIGSESGRGGWITCKQRRLRDGETEVNSSYLMKSADSSSEIDNINSDVLIIADGKNYKQCYRCSTTEYFTCRMTCMGDVCTPTSSRAEELCKPPNTSVYLTYVGGEFKVGVSLGIPRRWIEQGSDLATVIATAPGLEARRLEQYLARELELKLQVRSTTKMKHLAQTDLTGPRQELERMIEEAQPMITKILGNIPGQTMRVPIIENLNSKYGDLKISTPIQEVVIEEGNEFGGEIIAIKGGIIIVRQGSFHYALNLKGLLGREFTFLERRPQIETQSYLDQWF